MKNAFPKKTKSESRDILTENAPTRSGETNPYGATTPSGEIPEQPSIASNMTKAELLLSKLEAPERLMPRRYYVAVMAFLGFCNLYALRTNLSIAILEMTSPHNITKNGTIVLKPAEFHWSPLLSGWILGAFFYGYITTQLPGGFFAGKWGGRNLFGLGILGTALLTLMTPPLAHMGAGMLIVVRIVEGIFEGVTYPSIHALWRNWAPPFEKTKLATIAFAGSYFGTVISMPLSAALGENWGWPSIFYVFGLLALLWCSVWFKTVRETPEADPRISPEEKKYIQESIGFSFQQIQRLERLANRRRPGKRKEKLDDPTLNPPWRSILTSVPVYAIAAAHFAENWGFYTMLTHLPAFMENILGFKLQVAGFLAALPYLVMGIVVISGGQVADYLRKERQWDTTKVRKLLCCGAFCFQTVFIILTAHSAHWTMAVSCITIAVGVGGLAWSGFSVNPLDIAPQYAGIVMGLSNTFATLPGMISPPLVGWIVTDPTNVWQWRMVFYIAASIYAVGAAVYFLFASGDRQDWAELPGGYVSQLADLNDQIEQAHKDDILTDHD